MEQRGVKDKEKRIYFQYPLSIRPISFLQMFDSMTTTTDKIAVEHHFCFCHGKSIAIGFEIYNHYEKCNVLSKRL